MVLTVADVCDNRTDVSVRISCGGTRKVPCQSSTTMVVPLRQAVRNIKVNYNQQHTSSTVARVIIPTYVLMAADKVSL